LETILIDDIIKNDKGAKKATGNKKPVGKGGAKRTSARNANPTNRPPRRTQNAPPQKTKTLNKSDGGKVKLDKKSFFLRFKTSPICRNQTLELAFAHAKPPGPLHPRRIIKQLHKRWPFSG